MSKTITPPHQKSSNSNYILTTDTSVKNSSKRIILESRPSQKPLIPITQISKNEISTIQKKTVERTNLKQKVSSFWNPNSNEEVFPMQTKINTRMQISAKNLLPIVEPKTSSNYIESLRKGYKQVKHNPSHSVLGQSAPLDIHPDIIALDNNSKDSLSPTNQRNTRPGLLSQWMSKTGKEGQNQTLQQKWDVARFQALAVNRSQKESNEKAGEESDLSLKSMFVKNKSGVFGENSIQAKAGKDLFDEEDQIPGKKNDEYKHSKSRDYLVSKDSILKDSFCLNKKESDLSRISVETVLGLGMRQLVDELKNRVNKRRSNGKTNKNKDVLVGKVGVLRRKLVSQGLNHLVKWIDWRNRANKRVGLKGLVKAMISGHK